MKAVQTVRHVQSVQAPSFILPRVAGEDEGGGWNALNGWNELNDLNFEPLNLFFLRR
jgi:hypothetical protein